MGDGSAQVPRIDASSSESVTETRCQAIQCVCERENLSEEEAVLASVRPITGSNEIDLCLA
ncbi:hypothetical protein Acr_00g0095180 [Actinidia rufa]|uniref:Uncharacterized protein n=1 Tax=Actinidia rufa TaxID=165716 RepID=A0A7J0DY90_9ERIC|nr:hypothetical protein Acr_00g0095180 [Actinidia rufa]